MVDSAAARSIEVAAKSVERAGADAGAGRMAGAVVSPERARHRGELDRATLALCKGGDRGAFRAFVLHYEHAVFAFLSRIVGAGPEVEDIAQEAFFRAYRAFAAFDVDSASRPSAWVLTIALRLALDAKRMRVLPVAPTAEATDHVPDGATPETLRAQRELGLAIAAAGAELPPDQRAAFILAEFHDLTIAEIAAALGVPENTAKSRLFRARQHMRQRLESLR
jgi:RNA polymerase sigma-70 factor (ECF subfamily)